MSSRAPSGVWLALVLAACGGGGGGANPDATSTPDVATSVCELPAGRLFLLEELHVAPYADGFDLDGDAEIDNEFGKMPSSVRNAVGAGYDGALSAGEWLIGTYIDGWTDPPTATDAEIGVHVLNVIDADVPADSSNNHSGDAEFWAASLFLDLNCESTTRTSGTLTDNVFHGERDRLDFPLNTGTGAVELDLGVRRVEHEIQVDHHLRRRRRLGLRHGRRVRHRHGRRRIGRHRRDRGRRGLAADARTDQDPRRRADDGEADQHHDLPRHRGALLGGRRGRDLGLDERRGS